MEARLSPDAPASPVAGKDLFGHPRGLTFMFATEMWERFSYFGMSALVVLYTTKYLFQPGRIETVIGLASVRGALEALFGPLAAQPLASLIFGCYTGFAYLTPIIGGLIADRVLGHRRTAVVGAVLMALGHFMMALEALFLPALLMLILGIGAFKPNISSQVGGLYAAGDPRRMRAYAIFYVGINLGAFLAPLVCGTLGEQVGWHYGFAAAGVGMLIGLAIYLAGWRTLPPDEVAPGTAAKRATQPLAARDWRVVIALLGLCALVSLFWATYDQQGNTIVLWAEDFTQRSIDLAVWQGAIPTTWFLALNPLMIFAFTPLVLRLWAWQRERGIEPSTVTKMALGCLGVALANLVMVAAAWSAGAGGKASALWLVGYFVLVTLGELHLAPVGLALISKVAPARILSMMMGVWFATTFPGDLIGGFLGSFWSHMGKTSFYLMIASVAALAAVAIAALSRTLKAMLDEG